MYRSTASAPSRIGAVVLFLSLVAVVTISCGSDGTRSAATGTTGAPTTSVNAGTAGAVAETTTTKAATTTTVASGPPANYLSIGDSYAQGYQPKVGDEHPPFTDGYAYLLPDLAKAKGYDLKLVNFGCGGATVSSLAQADGCNEGGRSPGGPLYEDESQLDAALAYLRAHPGSVELITVSIGGNDLTSCATNSDPVRCVGDAVGRLDEQLDPVLRELREAAGPETTIVGLTYPDVILGAYLRDSTKNLAELSVVAFEQIINPMLKKSYEGVGGVFVDITKGTDAYVPLDQTTDLSPYGEIPLAVARVCELTWFCERTDIHPKSEGYERIAELIAEALPAK